MDRYSVVIPYTEPDYKSSDHVYYANIDVSARSPGEAKTLALKEFKMLTDLSWVRWARKIISDGIRVDRSGAHEESRLSLRTEELGAGVSLLEAVGALDAATDREFERKLDELAKGGRRRVIVDLSGLDYINSSGIGVLVQAKENLDMCLVAVQPKIRKVMDMVGLDRAFRFFDSVEQAVQ